MSIDSASMYNMYNNPYFLAALNSYNPNFKSAKQKNNIQNTGAVATQNNTKTTTSTSTSTQPYSSDNSTAKLLVTGALTVGAAVLCRRAYVKGSGSGMAKLTDGFKQMWNGLWKNGAQNAKNTQKTFALTQNANGEWIVRVPGKGQYIKATDTTALKKYGISEDVVELGKKGTKLDSVVFKHDGNTFTVTRKGITQYISPKNENNMHLLNDTTNPDNVAYKRALEKLISQLRKGKTPKGVEIVRMNYSHTADGVTRKFTQIGSENAKFKSAVTDRFTKDSEQVQALGIRDPKVGEILKAINNGKIPTGMNISGNYNIDKNTIVHITDGKITGVTKNGEKLSKDGFTVWESENSKQIEKIKKFLNGSEKVTLENPVYSTILS